MLVFFFSLFSAHYILLLLCTSSFLCSVYPMPKFSEQTELCLEYKLSNCNFQFSFVLAAYSSWVSHIASIDLIREQQTAARQTVISHLFESILNQVRRRVNTWTCAESEYKRWKCANPAEHTHMHRWLFATISIWAKWRDHLLRLSNEK